MTAYYNENDPFAAAWLRELIKAGQIADGVVDDRSIEEVRPDDLDGFAQCHFFAGIGVWSYALRLAGVPDDYPTWTGSCPCPPFSSAGKKQRCSCGGKPLCHAYRTGYFRCTACGQDWFADGRHLWPEFHRLIRERHPSLILGEQVAGRDGEAWGDVVQSCLEIDEYTCGRVSFAACGVGAPHQRKRLYWVANTDSNGCHKKRIGQSAAGVHGPERNGAPGGMADTTGERWPRRWSQSEHAISRQDAAPGAEGPGPTNGHWRDADWLGCRDGKWRPVEPGSQPLADGLAHRLGYVCIGNRWSLNPLQEKAENRVGRLSGYGNAVCSPQCQAFVEAVMETI